jgi:hypothetical protein
LLRVAAGIQELLEQCINTRIIGHRLSRRVRVGAAKRVLKFPLTKSSCLKKLAARSWRTYPS